MFRVGQKVVCVRNTPEGKELAYASGKQSSKIAVGSIYTIREIDTRALHLHGVACIRLCEIVNSVRPTIVGEWESGYPATCFRPVIERKTDISIFKKMLTPKRVGVDA